jgi:hypothetical protein
MRRIAPEKGLDRAIRIARLAGLPLKIAARMPLKDRSSPDVRKDWDYAVRSRSWCETVSPGSLARPTTI